MPLSEQCYSMSVLHPYASCKSKQDAVTLGLFCWYCFTQGVMSAHWKGLVIHQHCCSNQPQLWATVCCLLSTGRVSSARCMEGGECTCSRGAGARSTKRLQQIHCQTGAHQVIQCHLRSLCSRSWTGNSDSVMLHSVSLCVAACVTQIGDSAYSMCFGITGMCLTV